MNPKALNIIIIKIMNNNTFNENILSNHDLFDEYSERTNNLKLDANINRDNS